MKKEIIEDTHFTDGREFHSRTVRVWLFGVKVYERFEEENHQLPMSAGQCRHGYKTIITEGGVEFHRGKWGELC